MNNPKRPDSIQTSIWEEVAEEDNPFLAAACYCHGYDVFGDVLRNASWIEFLFVLFCGEKPTLPQAQALEAVAIALANPGPRDLSIRAAMNAGVGGSSSAAALMAALAVGAGGLGGGREIAVFSELYERCGTQLELWREALARSATECVGTWPSPDHPPGFEPWGATARTPVKLLLERVVELGGDSSLRWLCDHRQDLEKIAGGGLAMSGAIAAALCSIGFTPQQSEMLYLFLRLPGAAVHALEQKALGWRKYPFFKDALKVAKPGAARGGEEHE